MEALLLVLKTLMHSITNLMMLPNTTHIFLSVRNKEQKQAYKEDEYIAGFIESQQQNLMGMGRVLVRVSGTEPKIRVMVEGEDMEAIQSSAERIADMIRQRIPGVC